MKNDETEQLEGHTITDDCCEDHKRVQNDLETKESFFPLFQRLYDGIVEPFDLEPSEEQKPEYLLNLCCEGRCYSCDQQVLGLGEKKKFVFVVKPFDKDFSLMCSNCKAFLFLDPSFKNETYNKVLEAETILRVPLLKKNLEPLLLKKIFSDKILLPNVVFANVSYSLFEIENNEESTFLVFKSRIYFTKNFTELNEKIFLEDLNAISNIKSFEGLSYQEILKKIEKQAPLSLNTESYGITFENIDLSLKEYKSFLFLDIDGTSTAKTFNKTQTELPLPKISSFLFRFLKSLERRKLLKTVICSGRPLETVLFMMLDSGLKPLGMASNGNAVFFPKLNDHLRSSDISCEKSAYKNFLKQIVSLIRNKYQVPIVECYENSPEILINSFYSPSFKDLDSILKKDKDVLALLKEFNMEVLIESDESGLIHLSNKNYSKGSTVKKLITKLGIPQEMTFNVGNHFNDLSFKNVLGKNYAVKNALKQYSDYCDYQAKDQEAKGTIECIIDFLTTKKLIKDEEIEKIKQEIRESYEKEMEHYFKS